MGKKPTTADTAKAKAAEKASKAAETEAAKLKAEAEAKAATDAKATAASQQQDEAAKADGSAPPMSTVQTPAAMGGSTGPVANTSAPPDADAMPRHTSRRTAKEKAERRWFEVKSQIKHDGEVYVVGKEIAVTQDQHTQLLAGGAISGVWETADVAE